VNELHVVVIVSQVPEFVCKQLRKNCISFLIEHYGYVFTLNVTV